MAQQVLLPQQQESDLDTILKGLQIAATGYGIYADTQKVSAMKSEQEAARKKLEKENEEKARIAGGIYNQGELDQVGIAGGRYSTEAPKEMTGVISAKMQTPQGLKDVFITPKSEIDRVDAGKVESGKLTDEQKRANEVSDKDDERVFNTVSKFQEKPAIRDARSKYEAATNASALLAKGQPNLDKLAYRAVFSMMERGIFRAEDAEDYGLPNGVLEKLEAIYKKGATNVEISPQERKNLQGFVEHIKRQQRGIVHEYAKKEATGTAAFSKKKSFDDIMGLLGAQDMLDELDKGAIQIADLENEKINGPSSGLSAPRIGVSAPNQLNRPTNKPPVIQNGHTYYWNPQTGKYE